MVTKIGHRGTRGHAQENTIDSFKKAIKLGVDMIEFDVRLTKDKIPIIIHDKKINRTTNGKGKVKHLKLKEIKKFNSNGEKIPSLEEVLKMFKEKTKFNIELKENCSKEVIKIIKKLKIEKDVIISSSNIESLRKIKKIKKALIIKNLFLNNIIGRNNLNKWFILWQTKRAGVKIIHPYFFIINKKFINFFKKRGYEINVWTINNKKTIKKIKNWGVDGIISDFPERID